MRHCFQRHLMPKTIHSCFMGNFFLNGSPCLRPLELLKIPSGIPCLRKWLSSCTMHPFYPFPPKSDFLKHSKEEILVDMVICFLYVQFTIGTHVLLLVHRIKKPHLLSEMHQGFVCTNKSILRFVNQPRKNSQVH